MFDLSKLSTELLKQHFNGNQWPLFKGVVVNDEQIEIQLSISEDLSFLVSLTVWYYQTLR